MLDDDDMVRIRNVLCRVDAVASGDDLEEKDATLCALLVRRSENIVSRIDVVDDNKIL
jgi:hypothetical protein